MVAALPLGRACLFAGPDRAIDAAQRYRNRFPDVVVDTFATEDAVAPAPRRCFGVYAVTVEAKPGCLKQAGQSCGVKGVLLGELQRLAKRAPKARRCRQQTAVGRHAGAPCTGDAPDRVRAISSARSYSAWASAYSPRFSRTWARSSVATAERVADEALRLGIASEDPELP